MDKNDDALTIRLLRERNDRLETTCRAYDRLLDTRVVDALRKRNIELETALWDVMRKPMLSSDEREKLKVILGNKYLLEY